ncbi:2-aminobenzoate-CoA ligase [Burkholderia pyrrocinia]|uniref:2-aminobenzoate-CoA ligase n=1 Tax=Burkholderia pyrrocinia TaxID=60550 RepID=A0A318HTT9_BURPY|nr:2-aminobenzoate-CoA ligase [Burkholderia pyrrocinia]SFW90283.1 AMP-binding enzyme C-terminal domain-containing protein [Burkholderia sp. NFACC33-1]SFY46437.1 AMP-binding enzyme C-terminal domain-containing protein [Burkholderia sp. NFPP32]
MTDAAAYLDDEGYLFHQARADEKIIGAGYAISPAEVERALLRHPAVVECRVVGQPDDRGGTLICAHIVLCGPASTHWTR